MLKWPCGCKPKKTQASISSLSLLTAGWSHPELWLQAPENTYDLEMDVSSTDLGPELQTHRSNGLFDICLGRSLNISQTLTSQMSSDRSSHTPALSLLLSFLFHPALPLTELETLSIWGSGTRICRGERKCSICLSGSGLLHSVSSFLAPFIYEEISLVNFSFETNGF